jgi:hypothetical protein
MKITIWPMLRDGSIKFFSDMKFFFSKDFINENYYKHFGYSLVLTIPCLWIMLNYMHLADTPFAFHIFVCGFGARGVNFLKEWFHGKKYGAPWSWEDINFGTYGGLLAPVILHYLMITFNF